MEWYGTYAKHDDASEWCHHCYFRVVEFVVSAELIVP